MSETYAKLSVTVLNCRALFPLGDGGTSNPYVVLLNSDNKEMWRTPVAEKTLNPDFNSGPHTVYVPMFSMLEFRVFHCSGPTPASGGGGDQFQGKYTLTIYSPETRTRECTLTPGTDASLDAKTKSKGGCGRLNITYKVEEVGVDEAKAFLNGANNVLNSSAAADSSAAVSAIPPPTSKAEDKFDDLDFLSDDRPKKKESTGGGGGMDFLFADEKKPSTIPPSQPMALVSASSLGPAATGYSSGAMPAASAGPLQPPTQQPQSSSSMYSPPPPNHASPLGTNTSASPALQFSSSQEPAYASVGSAYQYQQLPQSSTNTFVSFAPSPATPLDITGGPPAQVPPSQGVPPPAGPMPLHSSPNLSYPNPPTNPPHQQQSLAPMGASHDGGGYASLGQLHFSPTNTVGLAPTTEQQQAQQSLSMGLQQTVPNAAAQVASYPSVTSPLESNPNLSGNQMLQLNSVASSGGISQQQQQQQQSSLGQYPPPLHPNTNPSGVQGASNASQMMMVGANVPPPAAGPSSSYASDSSAITSTANTSLASSRVPSMLGTPAAGTIPPYSVGGAMNVGPTTTPPVMSSLNNTNMASNNANTSIVASASGNQAANPSLVTSPAPQQPSAGVGVGGAPVSLNTSAVAPYPSNGGSSVRGGEEAIAAVKHVSFDAKTTKPLFTRGGSAASANTAAATSTGGNSGSGRGVSSRSPARASSLLSGSSKRSTSSSATVGRARSRSPSAASKKSGTSSSSVSMPNQSSSSLNGGLSTLPAAGVPPAAANMRLSVSSVPTAPPLLGATGTNKALYGGDKSQEILRAAVDGSLASFKKIKDHDPLLAHGFMQVTDFSGRNALHLAAWYGNVEILECLLGQGTAAMINISAMVTKNAKNNILHSAALGGNPAAVEWLLFQPACQSLPLLRNTRGLTPYQCALEAGNMECAKALAVVSGV